MRKLLPIAAVLAVAVLANQFATATGTRIAQEETIVLTDVITASRIVDAGNPGTFSVGDLVAIRARLDDGAGTKVGNDRTNCVSNKGSTFVCTAEYTIEGRGDITAQWVQDFSSIARVTGAITGGTGEYENVRGSIEIAFASGSPEQDLTLHLLP